MYIFVFEIKIAGQWIIPLYKLILLRSVEILLRSQLWIQLFKEKYFSLFFIPTGMTYSILRSSHVFRKNLVSSMLLNVLHLINSLRKYGWRGTIWLKMHNLILFLRQPLSDLLCIIFIMFNNSLRNERATFIMRSLFMTKSRLHFSASSRKSKYIDLYQYGLSTSEDMLFWFIYCTQKH